MVIPVCVLRNLMKRIANKVSTTALSHCRTVITRGIKETADRVSAEKLLSDTGFPSFKLADQSGLSVE